MNKLFYTLMLLVSTFSLQAQSGYLKFNKNKELDGKKFFKGEIYPIAKETQETLPFYFIVGSDTINVGKSVDKLKESPEDKTSLKDDFVKVKDGDLIHVDLSSISDGSDTIRLISEKSQVISIIKTTSKDFEVAKIGKFFRLIIPNSPSIYYSTDNLTKFIDTSNKTSEAIVVDDKKKIISNEPSHVKEVSKASNQTILLSILGLLLIGIVLWLLFIRKNTRIASDLEPIYMTYSYEKSLSAFAMDNHINLEKLIRYNNGLIDKKYNRFPQKDRKDVQKNLNNSKLIVGFREIENLTSSSNFAENEPLTNEYHNSNDLQEVNNEKVAIENKLSEFETKKTKLDLTLKQLLSEKTTFENKLQTAMTEYTQVQNEIKELNEKLSKLSV